MYILVKHSEKLHRFLYSTKLVCFNLYSIRISVKLFKMDDKFITLIENGTTTSPPVSPQHSTQKMVFSGALPSVSGNFR